MFGRWLQLLGSAIAKLGKPSIMRDETIPPGVRTKLVMVTVSVPLGRAGGALGDLSPVQPVWIELRAEEATER